MATFTNYCDSGSKAKRYALRLTVNYGEKNVSTNKTPISYSLELAGASYFGLSVDYTGSSFYGYTCNGSITVKNASTGATLATATGSSTGKVSSSNVITIASGSTEVPHNPDGTLTLNVSGTFTGGLSSQTNGGSVSGPVPLPTIPRASSVTASACDIESFTSISIDNLGGFTHTLKLQFGSLTRYVTQNETLSTSSAKLTGNKFQPTIPSEWYAQIPNSPSGTCTVTCTTYNGSTQVGDPKTTTFTVTANKEKSKPLIDFGAMRVTADNDEIYNVDVDNDTFVKHFSKIRIDDGIYAQNYAKLKTTKITNGTQTVDGYYNSENILAITLPQPITNSTIDFVVTDSREYPNAKTYTIPSDKYIPYEFPRLNANFVRNLPTDGVVNLEIASGSYYSGTIGGESNSLSAQYRYREVKTETWSSPIDLEIAYENGVVDKQTITLNAEFDYKKSYEFQLVFWDILTQDMKNDSVSMGIPVFWWNKEKFVINANLYRTNEDGEEIPITGGGSSEGGTSDYEQLSNKPAINGVKLSGDKTLGELGIQPKGNYQSTLVSGKNIKTVNGYSLLGEGDLSITGGGGGGGLIDSLPVGTMIPYGSSNVPDNWLSCNGQAVSRTTYSHLFAVIGTSYGEGDGSTTFNLPDKRGRVSVGYDPNQDMFNKVGAKVGSNTHTLTTNEMPWHYHNGIYNNYTEKTVTTRGDGGGGYFDNVALINPSSTLATTYSCLKTGYTGGDAPFSIVQASEVDHWIIKAYPLSNPEGTLDPLPVGTIVEYDGEEIPDGFEELEEARESSYLYGHIYGEQINTNASASVAIPFSEVRRKGEGIKFNGTKIEIGAGVKRVEMSFLLHGQASSSAVSQVEYGVRKNGTIVYKSVSEHSLSANMTTYLIMPTCEIAVTEGDYLEVIVYSATTFIVNSNYANLSFVRIKEAGNDTVDNFIVNDAQEYSDEEKKIGTWFGKPLYRKVVQWTSGLAGNTTTTVGNIPNAQDIMIKDGWLKSTNDTKLVYPLNMIGYSGNTTDKVYVSAEKENIKAFSTGGWSAVWKLELIIEYTKTTD